jgi:hypothetical protein
MSTAKSKFSINDIEKNAFRLTLKDGLFELSVGLVLIGIILNLLLTEKGIGRPFNLLISFLPIFIIYYVLKRYVVTPRMGIMKFGKTRKLKLKKMLIIILVFIMTQVTIIIFTKANLLNVNFNMLLIFGISFFLVFIPLALIAYFKDYPRFYLVAIIAGLLWPITELLVKMYESDTFAFITFFSAGFLFVVLGSIQLIKFVIQNPIPRKDNLL